MYSIRYYRQILCHCVFVLSSLILEQIHRPTAEFLEEGDRLARRYASGAVARGSTDQITVLDKAKQCGVLQ